MRSDPLFGGLTRPALLFGVPVEAFLFVAGGTIVVFLVTCMLSHELGTRMGVLLIGVVFYAVARLLCARDARAFRYKYLQSITKMQHRTRSFWQSGSYSMFGARKRNVSGLDMPKGMQVKQGVVNVTKTLTDLIPVSRHISSHNLVTPEGDGVTVIRIDGASHETADDADLDLWHDVLKNLVKNMARQYEGLALWSTLIREQRSDFPGGTFDPGFARDLNDKYRASLQGLDLMVNTYYLTIVLRPRSAMSNWLFGRRGEERAIRERLRDLNERLDSVADMALANLNRHNARRLATFEESGIIFSEVLAFYSRIINGQYTKVAVPKGKATYSVVNSRLSFGVQQYEVRGVAQSEVGAMLGVADYQVEFTEPGHLNVVMTLPFPVVVTQSFAVFPRNQAVEGLKKQQRLLDNAKDPSESQIAGISEALDDVTAGRVVYGEHHLTLDVRAGTPAKLNERLAAAQASLSEVGLQVVREDECLEAAWFAQLPGNFRYRPRPAPISSSNLIGFSSFHNYSIGRFDGNQWGPALTMFKTTAGTPYFLNFHVGGSARRKIEENEKEDRVPGHTLLLGPTGAGKTVLQCFLLAQAEKYKPTVFTFDMNQGQENFILAMKGRYSRLKKGVSTGLNPAQMADTPGNRIIVGDLVKRCIQGNSARFEFSAEREDQVRKAVDGVFGLPMDLRRWSRFLEFFPRTDDDGNYQRFQRWCEGGVLGWVFDNPTDTLSFDPNVRHYGFDVTDFIEDDEIRTGVCMYLFHRMDELIDDRRFILNMDEFWRMLLDPMFAAKALEAVKTYRKRNALAMFGTQSPADVLKAPISTQLIEQCVTQIYLPNPKARIEDYKTGFALTDREFEVVKRRMPEMNMRGFLVKQGTQSAICDFTLKNMDNELAVLSSNSNNILLSTRAIESAGTDPAQWLPVFYNLCRKAA